MGLIAREVHLILRQYYSFKNFAHTGSKSIWLDNSGYMHVASFFPFGIGTKAQSRKLSGIMSTAHDGSEEDGKRISNSWRCMFRRNPTSIRLFE